MANQLGMTLRVKTGDGLRHEDGADPGRVYRAMADAVGAGLFEDVIGAIEALPDHLKLDARFQQLFGLARRGLLDSASAHKAFAACARQFPADPLIAHSLARTALEAGFPSLALFDRARKLEPGNHDIILGRAAAQLAEGKGKTACSDLAGILRDHAGWIDGHLTFARISAIVEPENPGTATLVAALRHFPNDATLWAALVKAHLSACRYEEGVEAAAKARSLFDENSEERTAFDTLDAQCRTEQGDAAGAQAIFDRLPVPADGDSAIWLVRNLIRLNRIDQALCVAERPYPPPGDLAVWPYRALLWRLTGDDRWAWLEGDERLIGRIDLLGEVGSLDDLAECLRRIHKGTGQPLNQSVRGGTQTDGMLFARAEPEILRLRAAITEGVRAYVNQLPPSDSLHPTLLEQRSPLRFSGSWSVRLLENGFHSDHVHTHGWISSAFYVALPNTQEDLPEAGWITFGENRRLLNNFQAFRKLAPKPGSLMLFPSTMWHGTRPLGKGERLTVAFDIARPQQQ
jgi:thioredoxin-like negative regulator of GroEL